MWRRKWEAALRLELPQPRTRRAQRFLRCTCHAAFVRRHTPRPLLSHHCRRRLLACRGNRRFSLQAGRCCLRRLVDCLGLSLRSLSHHSPRGWRPLLRHLCTLLLCRRRRRLRWRLRWWLRWLLLLQLLQLRWWRLLLLLLQLQSVQLLVQGEHQPLELEDSAREEERNPSNYSFTRKMI